MLNRSFLIVLLALSVGAVVGGLFVRRELRLEEPLIDMSLFRVPAVVGSLVCNMAGVFALFGAFFFIAHYLQLARGMTPLEAGFWVAPSGAIFAASSLVTPWIAQRFRPSRIIAASFLVTGLGFIVLALVEYYGVGAILLGLILCSLGFSPVATLTTDLVMTSVAPEKAGQASGISETSFEFGGATGIALLGSIFVAVYQGMMVLPAAVPHDIAETARRTLDGAFVAAKNLPADQGAAVFTTASNAFAHAFAVTSVVSALIAFTVAVFAFLALRGPHDLPGREREPAAAGAIA